LGSGIKALRKGCPSLEIRGWMMMAMMNDRSAVGVFDITNDGKGQVHKAGEHET
jgi:hypothetical protein